MPSGTLKLKGNGGLNVDSPNPISTNNMSGPDCDGTECFVRLLGFKETREA